MAHLRALVTISMLASKASRCALFSPTSLILTLAPHYPLACEQLCLASTFAEGQRRSN